jgi:hypothetical protein
MMYRAVCVFRDLTDKHLYNTDDVFPFDGREIPAERLEALLTGKNVALKPLIREDRDSTSEPVKAPQRPKKRAKAKE